LIAYTKTIKGEISVNRDDILALLVAINKGTLVIQDDAYETQIFLPSSDNIWLRVGADVKVSLQQVLDFASQGV
jgi:hypothetical protein